MKGLKFFFSPCRVSSSSQGVSLFNFAALLALAFEYSETENEMVVNFFALVVRLYGNGFAELWKEMSNYKIFPAYEPFNF